MRRTHLPQNAFIAPDRSNVESVRQLIEAVLDAALHHRTRAAHHPVLGMDDVDEWPDPLPDSGISRAELLNGVERLLATTMNPGNPGYIGHMDTMPTTASIAGDLLAAVINNNMLSYEMSRALTTLETRVIDRFCAAFGLPETAGGVLVSGGTLANLQALAIARNAMLGTFNGGLPLRSKRPVILASDAAHTSLKKAAMVLGLGQDAVLPIAVDAWSRMDTDDLRAQIQSARDQGLEPFCVVATAGTTVTGSIDPMREIATICQENGLWFHADAAYGGAMILSQEHAARLRGVEDADSLTFNPQKWLYIAKTSAMILFRDRSVLDEHFRVGAPYMGEAEHDNLGEITIQGTRHADIIKLWLSLSHIGRQGFGQLIDESYRLTWNFMQRVRQREQLILASPGDTNLVCFRIDGDDALNTAFQESLVQSGSLFLSLPLYHGQRWIRAVLLNPYSDTAILDDLFDKLDKHTTL